MRIAIIDNDSFMLQDSARTIKKVRPQDEVLTFEQGLDLLQMIMEKPCQILFMDPYMEDMDGSMLAREIKELLPKVNIISGNARICALMRLRLGYTSSLTPSKNPTTLRRVSSMVLSFLRDMRSMAEELLSRGLRKSMQSMKPPDGNPSSNIMISLISSVRTRRLRISEALLENLSFAVLSAAYVVEHLSDMICLILSNPILYSSLVSILSKSFSSYLIRFPLLRSEAA